MICCGGVLMLLTRALEAFPVEMLLLGNSD